MYYCIFILSCDLGMQLPCGTLMLLKDKRLAEDIRLKVSSIQMYLIAV